MIVQTETEPTIAPQRGFVAQRIDLPHHLQNGSIPPSNDVEATWPDSLLHLHSADLIVQLQRWTADIDDREAQLNARVALQEMHERQFRNWVQNQQFELQELTRAATAHEQQLRAAVRRAAIVEASQLPSR